MLSANHCTVDDLARLFAGCQEEVINEWRLQAGELLRELNLDKPTITDHLPDVVAEFPDLVYIVLGATHPHELRTRGEAYRLSLQAIARNNKIENNVIFHNRFVELKELTEFIGAADYIVRLIQQELIKTRG